MITSSSSRASSPARPIACFTTWPPILAPWVMLRAPRQLLQSGVRAVETMTASFAELAIELPSFIREFDQEWRGFPDCPLIALLKRLDRAQDLLQPDCVRIKHRPAAVGR